MQLKVDITTLQMFSEIVKVLGQEQEYENENNLVIWIVPYRKESCDLKIIYDLENHRIRLVLVEPTVSTLTAKYNYFVLKNIIEIAELFEAEIYNEAQ